MSERPWRLFAHRLALALGRVDVDQMLSEITSEQLAEWKAYHDLEPFGSPRDDHRAGLLCAMVATFSGNTKKHDWAPSDFIPSPASLRKKQKETLSDRLKAHFKALSAKTKRKKR